MFNRGLVVVSRGTCIYLVMPKSQHVKFVLTLNLDIDPRGETDEAIRGELEEVLNRIVQRGNLFLESPAEVVGHSTSCLKV